MCLFWHGVDVFSGSSTTTLPLPHPFHSYVFEVSRNVLNIMTKPGKWKKQEKGSKEEDSSDNSTKLTGVGEAKTNAASTPTPPTNKDVLAAINMLNSMVNKRFAKLNGSFLSLKSTLSDVCKRVSSTEAATESHERRIEELERWHDTLASQYMQQQATLDDLEAHSHWQKNICIIGVKEKAEDGRPTEFVTMLLPKLLGEDHFDQPTEVAQCRPKMINPGLLLPGCIISRWKSWCCGLQERRLHYCMMDARCSSILI